MRTKLLLTSLFANYAMAALSNQSLPIELKGHWVVESVGSECVTTGWLNEQYLPKMGAIVGISVVLDKGQLTWGKAKCTGASSKSKQVELTFFDGSACRDNPGVLPKGCDKLMTEFQGKSVSETSIECKGSDLIPRVFTLLSNDWALANMDGDYICLKRVPAPKQ